MRLCLLFLLIGLYACGQTEKKKYSVNPKVKQLNDSVLHMLVQTEYYNKAIALLDEEIKLDSNYYPAYVTKVSLLLVLKRYDEALPVAKKLNVLRPESPIYYFSTGLLYERLHDTISSKKFFTEANTHFDKILDTMSKSNGNYENLVINKAVNLILLGQQQNGYAMLKQIYDNSKSDIIKEMISPIMNKTKEEVLKELNQAEEQDSSPIEN